MPGTLRYFCLCYLFYISLLCAPAQVPQVGKSSTLEVASWNIEWFGNTQNGPSDEALQYANVKSVLAESNIDVWALEEVSDTGRMKKLVDETGIYEDFYASFWQTQKTALLWRKSLFNLLSARQILQPYSTDFANGRLPIEVTLCTKNYLDTFVFVVIHLKAHTGTDTEKRAAWLNRNKSAGHLSAYLELHSASKVFILGDWNDDIDRSIYKDTLSPFKSMADDPRLHFLLKSRSLAGEHSYLFGEGMIDHILVNENAYLHYQAGSAEVFYLQQAIPGYADNTSDHYPVFAKFLFTKPNSTAPLPIASAVKVWPNPSSDGIFTVQNIDVQGSWELIDAQGKLLKKGISGSDTMVLTIDFPGIYTLIVRTNNNVYYKRLLVKG